MAIIFTTSRLNCVTSISKTTTSIIVITVLSRMHIAKQLCVKFAGIFRPQSVGYASLKDVFALLNTSGVDFHSLWPWREYLRRNDSEMILLPWCHIATSLMNCVHDTCAYYSKVSYSTAVTRYAIFSEYSTRFCIFAQFLGFVITFECHNYL